MTNQYYTNTQYLALYPNQEVRFVSRTTIPSKSKAGTPSRVILSDDKFKFELVSGKWTKKAKTQATDAPAAVASGAAALDSNVKFEGTKNSLQQISPGYGAIKQSWPSFSSRARRAVSLRACAIANIFPKKEQVFLTGTLPGSTPEAIKTFAAWSSWIMHRVSVWLRDNYSVDENFCHCPRIRGKKQTRNCYHLAVYEHQQRGALHYHGLVATPKAYELIGGERDFFDVAYTTAQGRKKTKKIQGGTFKKFWIELLLDLSERTGVDLFRKTKTFTWRNNLAKIQAYSQTVKKSVAHYLSKYLSKDASKVPEPENRNESAPPPARWWSSTRAVRKLADAQTIILPLPSATFEQGKSLINECLEFFSDLAPFFCPVQNSYSGLTVAAVGIFDRKNDASAIFQMLSTHLESILSENKADIELMHTMRASERFSKAEKAFSEYLDASGPSLTFEQLTQTIGFKSLRSHWLKTLA